MSLVSHRLTFEERAALLRLVRPGNGKVIGKNKNTGEFAVFKRVEDQTNGLFPKGHDLEGPCSRRDAGTISEALADGHLVLTDGQEAWARVDIKESKRRRE